MKTLILAVAVIVTMFACNDESSPTGKQYVTPGGAKVVVLSGPDLDSEATVRIDQQISRLNQVAAEVGLAKDPPKKYSFPKHSEYVIELVQVTKDCGTTYAFRTNGNGYGEETICVAGRYYPDTNKIRTTVEALKVTNALQYEGEHFGLRYNDPEEYVRTMNHLTGPPHPVLGKE